MSVCMSAYAPFILKLELEGVSPSGKVGGLMILLTSGDRDQCDLTHKPSVFQQKT